jgi:hypothetical protein
MRSSRIRNVSSAAIAASVIVATGGIAWSQGVNETPEPNGVDSIDAAALLLPGANQFVSGLDLECFDTQGPALNVTVQLTHLNPVLVHLGMPAHPVVIRELRQTCVPVQKNGVSPQPAALPFIRQVDLACYRVEAAPITPRALVLKHLNPVLANIPAHMVTMTQPNQLCLPVAKNGVIPTPDILRLIRFIDLECYTTDPGAHPSLTLNLKQLNPQLGAIPPHNMTLVAQPRQMCVPVRKNNQAIPADVLNIVQWVDLEKFAASPLVFVPPVNVTLNHLNPMFTTLPAVPVTLRQASALLLPVSKNGAVPPPP